MRGEIKTGKLLMDNLTCKREIFQVHHNNLINYSDSGHIAISLSAGELSWFNFEGTDFTSNCFKTKWNIYKGWIIYFEDFCFSNGSNPRWNFSLWCNSGLKVIYVTCNNPSCTLAWKVRFTLAPYLKRIRVTIFWLNLQIKYFKFINSQKLATYKKKILMRVVLGEYIYFQFILLKSSFLVCLIKRS